MAMSHAMRFRLALSLVATAFSALAFSGVASAAAGVSVMIAGVGSGRVTDMSGAINCPGGACSVTSDTGATLVVTLHATPAARSAFAGWQIPSLPFVYPPFLAYTPRSEE